ALPTSRLPLRSAVRSAAPAPETPIELNPGRPRSSISSCRPGRTTSTACPAALVALPGAFSASPAAADESVSAAADDPASTASDERASTAADDGGGGVVCGSGNGFVCGSG